jgi:hypothetical protein
VIKLSLGKKFFSPILGIISQMALWLFVFKLEKYNMEFVFLLPLTNFFGGTGV